MTYPTTTAAHSQSNPKKLYGVLPPAVLDALNAAHSPNTVRGYKTDLNNFVKWGGNLPSTPEQVASYMVSMVVEKGYKIASVIRSLYAISHWHRAQHTANPVSDELVRQARRGLVKTHGQPPKQSEALELPALRQLLAHIGTDSLIDVRDRALLTLGFFGAFRRSELVSISVDQLQQVPEGLEVRLHRSKTNKFGRLEIKPIVYAQAQDICPINCLNQWLVSSGITEGDIFRSVSSTGKLSKRGISAQTFYNMLKTRAEAAGFADGEYSPHSLRAGFITTAYKAGKDRYRIKQVSGHKSDAVLDMYIRDADRFTDCAGRLA